jgi:PleD family two-component response regulator
MDQGFDDCAIAAEKFHVRQCAKQANLIYNCVMAERILIIEDEIKIADFLRRGLAYEGYKVEVTNDGESGLKAARDNVPDLVILDVMLPGLDGLEVARRLRSGGETQRHGTGQGQGL